MHYHRLKRFFDIVFSFLLLILFFPFFFLISVFIIFFSGFPIFFFQERIGFEGKIFKIIKFRTMIINAEKIGSGLQNYQKDSRVTSIGSFLRKTSLDELPQLINILKGDMSFVGPRPPVSYSPYKFEDYPKSVVSRFNVRPGVTGLAQVNGRNNLNWNEKFKFDKIYISKIGFFYDFVILLKTIIKVITNEGSYDKR